MHDLATRGPQGVISPHFYAENWMTKQMPDAVMTIDDLAKYLKVSTSTLYKLCADGKVPGQKVGRHWRFRKEVIDNWLSEAHRVDRK